jgi:hypothetical protein
MSSATSSNSVIIDNVVVSNLDCYLRITPLSIFLKKNISTFGFPRKSYGSRIEDTKIIAKLSDGLLNFSDL